MDAMYTSSITESDALTGVDEMDRETVITRLQVIHTWAEFAREYDLQFFTPKHLEDIAQWSADALAMMEEQEEIEGRYIEAFNTIRDAYNAPANREKILLNYLARNACCCEQKLLNDKREMPDAKFKEEQTL